jgi:hypothetical protein
LDSDLIALTESLAEAQRYYKDIDKENKTSTNNMIPGH